MTITSELWPCLSVKELIYYFSMSCLTEQGFCNDDRDASQACKTKKCFIVAWKN
jgi:hypothetical protein